MAADLLADATSVDGGDDVAPVVRRCGRQRRARVDDETVAVRRRIHRAQELGVRPAVHRSAVIEEQVADDVT